MEERSIKGWEAVEREGRWKEGERGETDRQTEKKENQFLCF